MTHTETIIHDNRELEIEFYYSEYIPEKWTLSNGDPGYPAEGGEFDLYSVKYMGKIKKDGSYDEKYLDGKYREIINLLSRETKDKITEEYIRNNGYLF